MSRMESMGSRTRSQFQSMDARSSFRRSVEFFVGAKSSAEFREIFVNSHAQNKELKYIGNFVKTSKYEIYSFLPKFLFEAFSRFANTYFLIVCVMQVIPEISTTDGIPFTALPLTVVLTIDAIAEALEDKTRHRDDHAANNTECTVMREGVPVKISWKQVIVGDILKIRNREGIPADCVLLTASDSPPQAVCYVETKSLDGETNLKMRQGMVSLAEKFDKFCKSAAATSEAAAIGSKVSVADFSTQFLTGKLECEHPNVFLDSFSGNVVVDLEHPSVESELLSEKLPLGINNVLLRGCVLRSTDYVYALVVNTGHDTKIVQSTTVTGGKLAELDRAINRQLAVFLFWEFGLCLVAAGLAAAWANGNENDDRFADEGESTFNASDYVKRACTFFLLVANMIPISLYVTMRISRFVESWFIFWDVEMTYDGEDPISGEKMYEQPKVRTMNLNDALGQVDYIFSDKTGTLTNNVMEFRKFSCGGISYGEGNTVIGIAALERAGKSEEAAAAAAQLKIDEATPHPRFISYRDSPTNSAVEKMRAKDERMKDLFFTLSLCHEVLLEHVKDDDGVATGEVRLSASSPDDQALVIAAKEFGYAFKGRSSGGSIVEIDYSQPSGYLTDPAAYSTSAVPVDSPATRFSVELLETLEFTSLRKRMSVIVRHPETKKIVLLTKGADSEVYARLSASEKSSAEAKKTEQALFGFADDGLRTLAVGRKTLSDSEFSEWHARYKIASSNLAELQKRKNKEDNAIDDLMDELEKDLELVGATAIEDKLQSGVPETIHSLALGGIKIWVLTGDKQETAINIGFACQLLEKSMKQILINHESAGTVAEMKSLLEMHLKTAIEFTDNVEKSLASTRSSLDLDLTDLSLVIDGAALKLALVEPNNLILLEIAKRCKAVVACRTSPKQKSQIVELVRNNVKGAKTLAIGDGANDVSMIQVAHIGIGISGQEGMQAVNASDYAIAQFRYLNRLLLIHGRSNYRRMSKLVLVMFYKNVVLILAQMWWSAYNGYSGQKFYYQLSVEVFNLILTALVEAARAEAQQQAAASAALGQAQSETLDELRSAHALLERLRLGTHGTHAFEWSSDDGSLRNPAPPLDFHSPVIQELLAAWTTNEDYITFLTSWADRLLGGENVFSRSAEAFQRGIELENMPRRVKDGFDALVLPLLASSRSDLRFSVSSRVVLEPTFDVRIRVDPR